MAEASGGSRKVGKDGALYLYSYLKEREGSRRYILARMHERARDRVTMPCMPSRIRTMGRAEGTGPMKSL